MKKLQSLARTFVLIHQSSENAPPRIFKARENVCVICSLALLNDAQHLITHIFIALGGFLNTIKKFQKTKSCPICPVFLVYDIGVEKRKNKSGRKLKRGMGQISGRHIFWGDPLFDISTRFHREKKEI